MDGFLPNVRGTDLLGNDFDLLFEDVELTLSLLVREEAGEGASREADKLRELGPLELKPLGLGMALDLLGFGDVAASLKAT